MGMPGYALFISVYGVEQIGKLALVDLGQVLIVFFVLMAFLIKERDGVRSTKVSMRSRRVWFLHPWFQYGSGSDHFLDNYYPTHPLMRFCPNM